jgi:hypothetical protein
MGFHCTGLIWTRLAGPFFDLLKNVLSLLLFTLPDVSRAQLRFKTSATIFIRRVRASL